MVILIYFCRVYRWHKQHLWQTNYTNNLIMFSTKKDRRWVSISEKYGEFFCHFSCVCIMVSLTNVWLLRTAPQLTQMVFKLKQKKKCMKRPLISNSKWIAAIYCQLETLRWTKGKSLHSETKQNDPQIFPSLLNLKRKQAGSWIQKSVLFYHHRTFLAVYWHDFVLMLIGLPILNQELSLFRDS